MALRGGGHWGQARYDPLPQVRYSEHDRGVLSHPCPRFYYPLQIHR